MFTKSTEFYDALYRALGKDYAAEAARVAEIAGINPQPSSSNISLPTLLDVACGTGEHLKYLLKYFAVEGLDLDAAMLDITRTKLPTVTLHQVDMLHFALGRTFDVVTCLFSSIGYLDSRAALNTTLQNLADHTKPGGLVLVEPWLTRDQFKPGHLHALFVDEPDLKIARMSTARIIDDRSIIEFQYLLSTREQGVQHLTEQHAPSLFTRAEYTAAFEKAGLLVEFDEKGLMERGLYIGRKPDERP